MSMFKESLEELGIFAGDQNVPSGSEREKVGSLF